MSEPRQSAEGAAGVIAARAALDRHIASNDALRAAGVFDPAYLLMTDDGIPFDRLAMLALIGDLACRVSISEMRNAWVRVRGDTAVVTGALRQKGAERGVAFERSRLLTDTRVRTEGHWCSFAEHAIAIDRG